MRKILLIVAILILVFILFVYPVLKNKFSKETTKDTMKIAFAGTYIPAQTVISLDMVELKEVPKDYVQPGYVTSKEECVGQLTISPISSGEQILLNKLTKTGFTLSSIIPIGKRALSISVDNITGVAGFINPGDSVDILNTFETLEGNRVMNYTVTLLQNVKVIAVGKRFKPIMKNSSSNNEEILDETFDSVTLALSPEEAELVTFATEKGKLRLTLRSKVDDGSFVPKTVGYSSLLKGKIPAKKEEPQKPEIIRGIEEKP